MANIPKPKVRKRKTETVRERAEKIRQRQTSQPRRKKVANATFKPVRGLGKILTKEYNPINIKNSKYSDILGKKVKFVPNYFKDSLRELKQVHWLKPRQAISLTFAVIAFSTAIAIFVQLLGYSFDKIVKEVILK